MSHWWQRIDWVNAVGQAALTVAGPLGAPLALLLSVRSDLRTSYDETVAAAIESSDPVPQIIIPVQELELGAIGPGQLEVLELATRYSVLTTKSNGEEVNPEQVSAQLGTSFGALTARLGSAPQEVRQGLQHAFFMPQEILVLLSDAGIDLSRINLNGSAEEVWWSVLQYLRNQPALGFFLLVYEAYKRAPGVPEFSLWMPPGFTAPS